jgi:CRP-like cAMP-binding protein
MQPKGTIFAMPATSNLLLAAIPRAAFRQIESAFAPVTLAFGDVLADRGTVQSHVYFPVTCVVSLLNPTEPSRALEIALAGREGMVGVPLALGTSQSPWKALVQGGGEALRIGRTQFIGALETCPPLRKVVHRYIHSLMTQVAQSATCNRYHLVEGRLAKWLLMSRDRIGGGQLRITQDVIASMLGVRRVGVSEAASGLQRKGLIDYSRGHIRILDHAGLENAACTCYQRLLAEPGAMAAWRPPARARA